MPASVTNESRTTGTCLQMDGLTSSTGKCNTPSQERFNVYDTLEIIVKASFDDEDTKAGPVLLSKWRGLGTTTNRRTYRLIHQTQGLDFYGEFYRYFQITASDTGGLHDIIIESELIYDLYIDTPFWLRCVFQCDENGAGVRSAAQFYISYQTTDDPTQIEWTSLVTTPTGGTGTGNDDRVDRLYVDGTDPLYNSSNVSTGIPATAPLTTLAIGGVGNTSPGTAQAFNGKIYFAELITDGTSVMKVPLTDLTVGVTSFTDAYGNVFTLTGTASIVSSGTLRTMTNEQFGSASLTWDQADFSWDDAVGTWDNPYTFANETKHSGSITNESIS